MDSPNPGHRGGVPAPPTTQLFNILSEEKPVSSSAAEIAAPLQTPPRAGAGSRRWNGFVHRTTSATLTAELGRQPTYEGVLAGDDRGSRPEQIPVLSALARGVRRVFDHWFLRGCLRRTFTNRAFLDRCHFVGGWW